MPKLLRDGELLSSWEDPQSALTIPVDVELDNFIDELNAGLTDISLITIEFSVFMDGRAFSIARSLRDHFDYQGELRAVGQFIPDQLHYLSRCGFNAFLFSEDVEAETIEECLNAFSEHYQAAVDDPQPLFRKRA